MGHPAPSHGTDPQWTCSHASMEQPKVALERCQPAQGLGEPRLRARDLIPTSPASALSDKELTQTF